jgi:hypothetical protein
MTAEYKRRLELLTAAALTGLCANSAICEDEESADFIGKQAVFNACVTLEYLEKEEAKPEDQ